MRNYAGRAIFWTLKEISTSSLIIQSADFYGSGRLIYQPADLQIQFYVI